MCPYSEEAELLSKELPAIERLPNETLFSITDLLNNYTLQSLIHVFQRINIAATEGMYRTIRRGPADKSHQEFSVVTLFCVLDKSYPPLDHGLNILMLLFTIER
jgi:hypothetical protein